MDYHIERKEITPDAKTENNKKTELKTEYLFFDGRFLTVLFSVIFQITGLFFVGLSVFYIFVATYTTFKYSNCSILRIDKAILGLVDCSDSKNQTFYSAINKSRAIICAICFAVIIYIKSQAGTSNIVYQKLEDAKTMDNFIKGLYFDGFVAHIFVELFLFSVAISGINFIDNYDKVDSALHIQDVFASPKILYFLTGTYFFLRLIYHLKFAKSKISSPEMVVVSDPDKDSKTDLIYRPRARTNSQNSFNFIFNIVVASLSLAFVLLINFYAYFNIPKIDHPKNAVLTINAVLVTANSLKHVVFFAYMIKNRTYKIKRIQIVHNFFLIAETAIALSNSNDETFNIILFVATVAIFFALSLVTLTALFVGERIKGATYSKLETEGGWETKKASKSFLEKLYFGVATTGIVLIGYVGIFELSAGFIHQGGENLMGYMVSWCKGIADKEEIKSALMSFRANETILFWNEVIYVFASVDGIALFLSVTFLILFPRRFPNSDTALVFVQIALLYSSIVIYRNDVIREAVYPREDLGFAVIEPKANLLRGVTFAGIAAQSVLLLLLATLSSVSGNIEPVDGSVFGREKDQNEGNLPETTHFTAGKFFVCVVLFAVLYFMHSSGVQNWVEVHYSDFDHVKSTKLTATGICSKMAKPEVLAKLEIETAKFIEKSKNFNSNFVESLQKAFFTNFFDKFVFFVPILFAVFYLFFSTFVSVKEADQIKILLFLIVLNISNLIAFNSFVVIIENNVDAWPGGFYEIIIDDGFSDLNTAALMILFCLLFELIVFFAPVQVPLMNQEEKELLP